LIILEISEIYRLETYLNHIKMAPRGINLVFMVILVMQGCHTRPEKLAGNETPVAVVTATASRTKESKEISLSGNVEGYRTVRLGFMVAGRINYIGAEEGGQVFRGRLLASLDPESYAIAKELADIQVSQIQDEYDRLKQMHDRKSLTESDFVKISSGLQQAKAQQKLHEKNLIETKLFPPFDGVLLKKLAEVGEVTGVGLPIFAVSDIRKVKVSAFIPGNELQNIRIGEKAEVTIPSLGNIFEGTIVEVGSAADPASRAFSLKIEVKNPGLLIRPGMIAEITVQSGLTDELLTIPVESVLHDYDGQSYIYVADTTKSSAYRRNISLGRLSGDRIEIISGLTENEIVVVGGQQKLVNGSVIAITK